MNVRYKRLSRCGWVCFALLVIFFCAIAVCSVTSIANRGKSDEVFFFLAVVVGVVFAALSALCFFLSGQEGRKELMHTEAGDQHKSVHQKQMIVKIFRYNGMVLSLSGMLLVVAYNLYRHPFDCDNGNQLSSLLCIFSLLSGLSLLGPGIKQTFAVAHMYNENRLKDASEENVQQSQLGFPYTGKTAFGFMRIALNTLMVILSVICIVAFVFTRVKVSLAVPAATFCIGLFGVIFALNDWRNNTFFGMYDATRVSISFLIDVALGIVIAAMIL